MFAATWFGILSVTDVPSQVFGIGLAGTAFCVLVYASNELRRSVVSQQQRMSELEQENRLLRKTLFSLLSSVNERTRRDVLRGLELDPDDGGIDKEIER